MKKTFLIHFCLFYSLLAYNQSYYFRHYQVENGLSNNAVLCSIHDKQGFLWFGTKDGLNRFDGYSFKVFRNNKKDSESIGSNFIQALYEDKYGIIWVGTDQGLYSYNPVNENFILLKFTSQTSVRDMRMDKDGNLWFISGFTLCTYDPISKNLKSYDPSHYFQATSLCISEKNVLWASTYVGKMEKYEPLKKTFTELDICSNRSKIFANGAIGKIYSTGKNSILIGTSNRGVKLYNTLTGECKNVITYNNDKTGIFVRDFISSSENEVWIATESGIFIYNIQTGKIINLKKQYNDPYSLSDNAIYTLCKDNESGIWAGTYFGGINYYSTLYNSFEKFFPKTGENSLSGNAVREICKDKFGNLWIGTEDAGLNEIKSGSVKVIHYHTNHGKGGITYNNIHGLLPINNELWVGTFEHGLDVIDIKTGKVTRHFCKSKNPTLISDFIYSIFQTKNGNILLGTELGLCEYNKKTSTFRTIDYVPPNNFIASIYEDSKGVIWAGTFTQGVYFFNIKTGTHGHFQSVKENKNGLNNNRVNGVLEDSSHNLWFSTEGGLTRYNPQKGEFKTFITANGFPSDVIYRSIEDDKGNIWISTSKGLVCMNLSNAEIQTYTTANGLLSDQFNYNSAFKDSDDNLYFGSVKGLIRFNPGNFVKTTFVPPVWITGFQVNNKELPLKKSITYIDKITLPYNESSISLDFAALSFTAPEMTKYMYKMEGLDKEWTYLLSNRKVYFTELSPGTYTFQVKACNNNNIWNNRPAKLIIHILPPIWLSPLAYLLYFISSVLLVYIIIRNYLFRFHEKNRHKIEFLQNEKEKEIYHAKIEFFTNVAHEIKTPLTLIKLPLEKTLNKSDLHWEVIENLKMMEKNTNRLIDLTNQLLDFRRTENDGFALTFVRSDITDFLIEIFTSFKPVADQKNLNFKLDFPKMHLQAFADPEAFKKILTNLLSNAVKYAETNVIASILPFNCDADSFTIRITNDGFPIPEEMKEKIFEPFFRLKETEKQPGTGIGLALSRSLAQLHNGSLTCQTKDYLNSFTLTLPIHHEKEFQFFNEGLKSEIEPEMNMEAEDNSTENKLTILLVEDNKEIIDFLGNELKKNYHILKAFNGNEAIIKLKEEAIQLVISDVMMPLMDGLELCKTIKTDFEFSHIPIILLTAKNTLQSKIEGLEMGADAYIEKPFAQQHLEAQITSLLKNRNKIKEYFASSPLVHIKSMAHSKADEKFLIIIDDIINKNIGQFEFNVEHLAKILNMSRPTLYRKIKGLSNLTPNELINITKLKRAAVLLSEGNYKIYEVAEKLGYTLQANFSRDFMKQFNMSPTEYMILKKTEKMK